MNNHQPPHKFVMLIGILTSRICDVKWPNNMNIGGMTMENEHEYGECECCGEHAKLHVGGLIVGGRDYGICRICDDCALPDDEYNTLVAQIDA